MKKIELYLLSFLFIGLITSCNRGKHFISDKQYRLKVEKAFEKQKDLAKSRSKDLFKVFDGKLTREEKEALQFLYAYMPLSDLADYNGDFYLKNVRSSLAARDTFSWGKTIPEVIFRHFVLPVRVNNENLDSSRWVFFGELKNRIRNMTMKDAVLEVNHWCHEKVTYKGSDGRTSSPLASVKTAYGRCGEESTFTVAALRSVGLPARQCYTPRWAHVDDNHAWVEAWVDGQWHYLGACEPEPVLDMGWFSAPAKRAMLVNTNVYGDYEGPEDILVKDDRFTRINILPNYTTTKRIYARVTDEQGKPLESARVEFQLYNYAEFYTLAKLYTGKNGLCSFQTGLGDLLVWTSKGETFGYRHFRVKDTDTVTIVCSLKPGKEYSESFDLVPPPPIPDNRKVSDSMQQENRKRFEFEDRIRSNYEQTFIDSAKTSRLAANLKMDADSLWTILRKSRGNWREIISFITSVPEEQKQWVFPLLYSLSDKDLRDVSPEVLSDNLPSSVLHSPFSLNKKDYVDYILCPRVDNEFLKPWRAYFLERFDSSFRISAKKDINTVTDWIKAYVIISDKAAYNNTPLTPIGVYELKVSDAHSRNIFFVAFCRSLGIPARLETATRIPQYFNNNKWIDVFFETQKDETGARSLLILSNDQANKKKPEYYIHFTIEKYDQGFYGSLDYETDPVMQSFPARVSVAPGSYLVVTGNRVEGGTVLVNLSFFDLMPGKTKEVKISLRQDAAPLPVYGKINLPEFTKEVFAGIKPVMDHSKGFVVAWLDPGKEPTRHFIADLVQKNTEFASRGGTILLLFRNDAEKDDFARKNATSLPGNVRFITVSSGPLSRISKATGRLSGNDLPVVAYINAKGEINYLSEGYKIGIGDDLLGLIK